MAGCDGAWLNDGECDETCNVPECKYDESDCPGGDGAQLPASLRRTLPLSPPASAGADIGECYTRADGADYRGLVQKTIPSEGHPDGLTCQKWSHQYPQTHTRSHANFPDSGLGGHSACRNPDGDVRAWCFTTDAEVRWDYCDVGKPQPTCNSTLRVAPPKNITYISFDTMYSATARESEIKFFVVPVPRHVIWAVLGGAKPRLAAAACPEGHCFLCMALHTAEACRAARLPLSRQDAAAGPGLKSPALPPSASRCR